MLGYSFHFILMDVKSEMVTMKMLMPVLHPKRKGRRWKPWSTLCYFSLGRQGIVSCPDHDHNDKDDGYGHDCGDADHDGDFLLY